MKSAIPKPETVWDLCAQAAEAIELAPTHYYQGAFAVPTASVGYHESESRLTAAQHKETCGTSFCRAGHMIAVLDADKQRTPEEWDDLDANINSRARALLVEAGVSSYDVTELFDGSAVDGCGKIGSKRYAKAGAKGLRDFMVKYETELKATKIPEGA